MNNKSNLFIDFRNNIFNIVFLSIVYFVGIVIGSFAYPLYKTGFIAIASIFWSLYIILLVCTPLLTKFVLKFKFVDSKNYDIKTLIFFAILFIASIFYTMLAVLLRFGFKIEIFNFLNWLSVLLVLLMSTVIFVSLLLCRGLKE